MKSIVETPKTQTNIEKLLVEILKEGPELLPVYLLMLEVGLNSRKHSSEEIQVVITDVT